MKTMRSIQFTFVVLCLLVFGLTSAYGEEAIAQSASPELIGQLTKSLNVTPAQASGGADADDGHLVLPRVIHRGGLDQRCENKLVLLLNLRLV